MDAIETRARSGRATSGAKLFSWPDSTSTQISSRRAVEEVMQVHEAPAWAIAAVLREFADQRA